VITLQYLEDASDLPERSTAAVLEKLRAAVRILLFSHLLIGWNLPPRLLEACRKEAERLNLQFLRWHPLLTGDAVFQPKSDWQVIGAGGQRVPGYRGMPEFTFVCPNHPAVQEGVLNRISWLTKQGDYQGFFLDRIRFPSPSSDPVQHLGCFCEYCRERAVLFGFDLEKTRQVILKMTQKPEGCLELVKALLGGKTTHLQPDIAAHLKVFLDFRQFCVTDFVCRVSSILRDAGMEIGLDCFSPGMARMVGQDLTALGQYGDWIKVMSYAHTLGPAGIPFELSNFCMHLSTKWGFKPASIMRQMGEALNLGLPKRLADLQAKGISSTALESELKRGVSMCSSSILAGMELVQIQNVAELNDEQILTDLKAIKRSDVAGLAISWDLWDIPQERFKLVRKIFPIQGTN